MASATLVNTRTGLVIRPYKNRSWQISVRVTLFQIANRTFEGHNTTAIRIISSIAVSSFIREGWGINRFNWVSETLLVRLYNNPELDLIIISQMVNLYSRVGEIQRLTEPEIWHHVPSAQNPADILSRGLDPYELINSIAWWQGPAFLQLDEDHWPSNDFPRLDDGMPELRKVCAVVITVDCSIVNEIISKHSNLNKACRVIAYCIRMLKSHSRPLTLFVSHEETSAALYLACKVVQQRSFLTTFFRSFVP